VKVSAQWLHEQKVAETKQGWVDGPVWRTPGMKRREEGK
jgi:hypothetical protein